MAQEGVQEPQRFPIERMRTAMDREGMVNVEWAAVPGHLSWDLGLRLQYSNDPLIVGQIATDGTQRFGPLVSDRFDGSLVAAVGLWNWVQLGIDVPVIVYQRRDDRIDEAQTTPGQLLPLTEGGLGDLRIMPKLRVLQAHKHGVDLSVLPVLVVPTGVEDSYFVEQDIAFAPELLISRGFQMGLRLAANFMYVARKNTQLLNLEVGDEIGARAGIGYRYKRRDRRVIEVDLMVHAYTTANLDFEDRSRNPAEVHLLTQYDVMEEEFTIFAGAGMGIAQGYGTPDLRILMGARVYRRDADGDGFVDRLDRCPLQPEDKDGFNDKDGCPEPDNDLDGLADTIDKCPLIPEDHDGYEDDDGCAELDNDGDGVNDDKDKCPLIAEDPDGYGDEDGCPESDNDGDKVFDAGDKCPTEPEDIDGFEDDDGCPDTDNDEDGVPDAWDKCPKEKGPVENRGCVDGDKDEDEVVDRLDKCPDKPGVKELDGCPPEDIKEIKLEGPITFRGRMTSKLSRDSWATLDAVATYMSAHPQLLRVLIEVHTKTSGKRRLLKRLSTERGRAIHRYLVNRRKIDRNRITFVGYGPDKPINEDGTREGDAKNERVIFRVVVTGKPPEKGK